MVVHHGRQMWKWSSDKELGVDHLGRNTEQKNKSSKASWPGKQGTWNCGEIPEGTVIREVWWNTNMRKQSRNQRAKQHIDIYACVPKLCGTKWEESLFICFFLATDIVMWRNFKMCLRFKELGILRWIRDECPFVYKLATCFWKEHLLLHTHYNNM